MYSLSVSTRPGPKLMNDQQIKFDTTEEDARKMQFDFVLLQ